MFVWLILFFSFWSAKDCSDSYSSFCLFIFFFNLCVNVFIVFKVSFELCIWLIRWVFLVFVFDLMCFILVESVWCRVSYVFTMLFVLDFCDVVYLSEFFNCSFLFFYLFFFCNYVVLSVLIVFLCCDFVTSARSANLVNVRAWFVECLIFIVLMWVLYEFMSLFVLDLVFLFCFFKLFNSFFSFFLSFFVVNSTTFSLRRIVARKL